MPEESANWGWYSSGDLPAGANAGNVRQELLQARAAHCAGSLAWLPGVKWSPHFEWRLRQLNQAMQWVFGAVESGANLERIAESDRLWLCENVALLHATLASLNEARAKLTRTTHARCAGQAVSGVAVSGVVVPGVVAPRILVVADDLLASLDYGFEDSRFSAYLRAFQRVVVLGLEELRVVVPALQCVLLERTAALANFALASEGQVEAKRLNPLETCIRSLREIAQAPWPELLEPLIVFDAVLRRDPAEAYARMDAESRERYRSAVVQLAKRSDHSELEVAELALSLARESQRVRQDDPVLAQRRAHVGYYLIAEGLPVLRQRANARPAFRERWQEFLRRYPDEFYLGGIELLTFCAIVVVLQWGDFDSLWGAFFAALVLLLPCSEGAVQTMNYLTSSLLQPQTLPKLDFRDAVPDECTTMVVVPTLLLEEKQVRQLASDLEVRYLGNMSDNLHFALLTDLPDSDEPPCQEESIVGLCGRLIRELNEKYAGNGAGTFFMFHRHRVYNPREGVWMGWERKRGKLLDFNRLILGQYDSFPYKVGDLSILPQVRYVLTVDSDTELPRGTAQRLVGTMAHPLCQAIVDSRNVVTQGYGILQPRVAVSVESADQSRLASIYSGSTGFDIYTHATSDVYQDLYDEGTFVGKGLYDLRTMHRVLDHRFPRNAILSHDLIEGAYARAGLVSDVEVVDRYPSHYSSYTRRKHRWVRGDWQIVEWLFSRVPDEAGRRVSNPISLISRWKIVDNLRRSMVGPVTLLLFVVGWLVMPGRPLYWTLVTLAILFVPPWIQFVPALVRAVAAGSRSQAADACASLATASTGILLFLAFLVHDALVSVDAAVRSWYRRAISRERLLEWVTAAEEEMGGGKRTSLDLYLARTPAIAAALGGVLLLARPVAFWVALPILMLWGCCRGVSAWVDRPPGRERRALATAEKMFLRLTALRTWRYFAEHSTAGHHWLVPDSVQEEPAYVAPRVSPTNLGFLLNVRQIACEFGYLTVPEFVEQTRRSLETMEQLRRHGGHFLNWYDTRTLLPDPPLFVSSVDSGNLAASLIALKVGCGALLERPLLSPALVEGYADHLRLLAEPICGAGRVRAESPPPNEASPPPRGAGEQEKLPWLERLTGLASAAAQGDEAVAEGDSWLAAQLPIRRERMREILADYMPWLLPEFASLRRSLGLDAYGESGPLLAQLPGFVQQLQSRLLQDAALHDRASQQERSGWERLQGLLPGALERSGGLVRGLQRIAAQAEHWVAEMDFGFLLERRRKLLSVGYHVDSGTLDAACYDLLASEARVAVFLAIAKGDVPQETWFRLGRTHVPVRGGRPTLISWAGTMFEYLMPALWMRSQRSTLLWHSMEGAVRSQKAYAAARQIPWGISEAGYGELDEGVRYRYAAMGVPELALREPGPERLVVAPYASAMALAVAPAEALENLRRMDGLGWVGSCGFYEAADFSASQEHRAQEHRGQEHRAQSPSLVRAWMAHHQGMILLSIGNLLCGNVVQQWFGGDVRVRATEMLLQERAVLHHVRAGWRVPAGAKPLRTPQSRGDDVAVAS